MTSLPLLPALLNVAPVVLAISAAILILFSNLQSLHFWRPKSFPGPSGLPLLGPVPQLATAKYAWKLFTTWSKKYGDVFAFNVAQQGVVVISNPRIAREVLEIKGAYFSDRPLVSTWDILDGEAWQVLGWHASNKRFKVCRGLYIKAMTAVPHDETINYTSKLAMRHALELSGKEIDYEEVSKIVHSYTLSTSYEWMFGRVNRYSYKDFTSHPRREKLFYMHKIFKRVVGQENNISTSFPGWCQPLLKIPQYFADRDAKELMAGLSESWVENFEKFNKATSRQECLTQYFIDNRDAMSELTDFDIMRICGNTTVAGTETGWDTVCMVLCLVATHPKVQSKIQDELDTAYSGKLPSLDTVLPYQRAVVKEVMRILPTMPLGIPHRCSRDTVVEGFSFEKGQVVIANAYAMQHDERWYPEPEKFKPERFQHDARRLHASHNSGSQRDQFNFGFGRRICPGTDLAEDMMTLFLSRFFWAFSISFDNGAEGVDAIGIIPDPVTIGPIMKTARITPRRSSDEIMEAIKTE